MAKQPRERRYTANPRKIEVDALAIPLLSPDGWRPCNLEEFPTVGTGPKNYSKCGDPQLPDTIGYIANKGRTKNDAQEWVTEEIISRIGAMLPSEMASSRVVRISKTDVRFLSRNFVAHGHQELLHGVELAARYFETAPFEVEKTSELEDKKAAKVLHTLNTASH